MLKGQKNNMEIDWNSVKKITLWQYEDLIEKILKPLSYSFIQEHYSHNMQEASNYVRKLLGYDPKYEKFIEKLVRTFKSLENAKIKDYSDLIEKVETRKKCENFLGNAKISFKDLISLLNYVFRWVLPFRNVYLKQLIDPENESHIAYIKKLKEQDIKFNLDILECSRTRKSRAKLSETEKIPEGFILDLTNRADLTRLPYMSKKTVEHLCNAGYDCVSKLAKAEAGKLREDMKSYFNKVNIRLGYFIDLAGLIVWARTVPKIIEI